VAFDVNESDFQASVIERSREVPVIVDFWAEWCGPCRVLGPALEAAVAKRDGELELAKVDVDRNQSLAASFGIRGIPAVKAFRDGQVVDEFTGAIPPAQIEQFVARIVPSPADRLAAADDEESLRKALELEPVVPPQPASWHVCCWSAVHHRRRSSCSTALRGTSRSKALRRAPALRRRSAPTAPTGQRRLSHAASPPGTLATSSKRSKASSRRLRRPTTPSVATWCAA
jgi:thioredoxin